MMKKSVLVAMCGMIAGFAWADAQAEAKADVAVAKPAVCAEAKVASEKACPKAAADKAACIKADADKAAVVMTDAEKAAAEKAAAEKAAADKAAAEKAVETPAE